MTRPTTFRLSLNTNPLVNRFAEPSDLVGAIAGEIGVGYIQLTHEFIDPNWPSATRERLTREMARCCGAHGVRVTSLMTGPYGRLNHFGHPDADVRRHSVDWFKRLADIARGLDCPAIGTQFAILTYRDYDDEERRAARLIQALDCWREVAEHASSIGLEYLFWEPMSVGREIGHTIESAARLQEALDAANLATPLKPMIDIDHGDVTSLDPADSDPYAWASAFAARSPIIHIKQSSMNKGGHWPFTVGAQPGWPDRSRKTARGGSGRRRFRQRALHGACVSRARAVGPKRDPHDPRVGRFLAPLSRRRRLKLRIWRGK